MIPSVDAVGLVIDALNTLGKPYIVTGSIASSAYSGPRATKDADFVALIDETDLKRLVELLRADFTHEPQMSFETVTGKSQHRFRYRHTPFLVEIFEADFNDPHEKARFDRRLQITTLNRLTYYPTAEDVVVGKLRWYARIRRSKDRGDIVNVMRHQWGNFDWTYIEHWCDEHDSRDALNELRAEVERQMREET